MIPEAYKEFFLAEAGASAALIGLLFVAISVAPERISGSRSSVSDQIRASTALTCLLVPMSLALTSLIPDTSVAIPAMVFSVTGLLFVLATLRRYYSMPRSNRESVRALGGLVGYSVVLGVILTYGIVAATQPTSTMPIAAIASATIASVLIGVERAWALIGGRSGRRASLIDDIIHGERPKQ